jgi:hypothetical protein
VGLILGAPDILAPYRGFLDHTQCIAERCIAREGLPHHECSREEGSLSGCQDGAGPVRQGESPQREAGAVQGEDGSAGGLLVARLHLERSAPSPGNNRTFTEPPRSMQGFPVDDVEPEDLQEDKEVG